MKPSRTLVATSVAVLIATAGVSAAIAADPAPASPPKIAFVANGIVPADALAAGPIAGQLGAPIYTTQQDLLPAGTADALDAYDPELVIVLGGPVAVSDAVITQIAAATGLTAVDATPVPVTGVVRAAGGDRFATATIVADLLAAYAPAYLPVGAQAVDAATLDGKPATAFQAAGDYLGAEDTATNADKLGGKPAAAYVDDASLLGAVVIGDGTLVSGPHAVSADRLDPGRYTVTFDRDLTGCVRVATPGSPGDGTHASLLHSTELSHLDTTNRTVYVGLKDMTSTLADGPFHLLVLC